jgi:hypothetical protein
LLLGNNRRLDPRVKKSPILAAGDHIGLPRGDGLALEQRRGIGLRRPPRIIKHLIIIGALAGHPLALRLWRRFIVIPHLFHLIWIL